jgi:DNA-binding NarL/FixJ family response regulator
MAGMETAVEAARRYIIKRPRLTRLLDNANARVLMLIAPAGFGKTTLAREWVAERPHVWYRATTATSDVAALIAGLADVVSEVIPDAGKRAVSRMRAAGLPEQDVDILADLFAEDLGAWPGDTWLVVDDYQFAMEADAPERLIEVLIRKAPVRVLIASRKRPAWATARRLLYGELYEIGRGELAMDHSEAAAVLAHRGDASAAGLVTLAEGWPAVIGLAALADDLDVPSGTLPQALYDFFAEELFHAAAPEVQQGLCKLSLAPTLSHGVMEFLLDRRASDVIAVGTRLGFLTQRGTALELHPLVRTFLEAKARDQLSTSATDVEQLMHHLADAGRWDDAFALLGRFFSSSAFIQLLERRLRPMLAEARVATLIRWLHVARANRIDAPVVDLAEAEIAFYKGDRRNAEVLASRATRGFALGHPLSSRAFNLTGMSAHLDYFNDRAGAYFAQALATATTNADKREAVWGQLNVALDLEQSSADGLLAELIAMDDGSATSEVRLATARLQHAARRSSINGVAEVFDAAELLLPRINDPHLITAFYSSQSMVYCLLGLYERALSIALSCERTAREARLGFVIPHAKRNRAVAELGLRHFRRCQQLVDWLQADAERSGDVFVALESRLIRAKLLVAQGLSQRALEILQDPPDRFPFEGDHGEYLAIMALAYACASNPVLAARMADEAEATTQAVETQALAPCVRAIVALQEDSSSAHDVCSGAFARVLAVGNVDSFVVAYRGYPDLLTATAMEPSYLPTLRRIADEASDVDLARRAGLIRGRPRSTAKLSAREEEVLGLIAQGLTNREIASTLYISESTAKVHVRHILEKLGVRSRVEAALKAASDPPDSID